MISDNRIKGGFALVAGIASIVSGRVKFRYSGQASGPAAFGIGLLLIAIGVFLLATG